MESPAMSADCKHPKDDLDLSENSPEKVKEQDEKKMEESHISELTSMVYNTIIRLKKVSKDDVLTASGDIIDSFKGFPLKFRNKIDLSNWEYSCAYLCRFGAHGAGLTRCRVLQALQKCQDLAKKFEEPNLSVINLGGGPGNDIIGLCSALNECNVKAHLTIKVIDSVKEWSLFLKIYRLFVIEGQFGNASKFFQTNDVRLTFLQAELPGNPIKNKEYFHALKEADIILMTKFISTVWDGKENIIQSLCTYMKDGAIILFIDSPFEKLDWTEFEELYVSDSGEEHDYIMPLMDEAKKLGFRIPFPSKARVAVLRKLKKKFSK